MNEDMYYEIDKLIYHANVMFLTSKTSDDALYWKGYLEAIDKILDIIRKYK